MDGGNVCGGRPEFGSREAIIYLKISDPMHGTLILHTEVCHDRGKRSPTSDSTGLFGWLLFHNRLLLKQKLKIHTSNQYVRMANVAGR